MTRLKYSRLLGALAASCLCLAIAPAASAASALDKCSNPTLRDATCVGSVNSPGSRPTDFGDLNGILPDGASRPPRGSNVITTPGTTVPTQQVRNECVAIPFVSWAYDPISFGVSLPSFITPAGSGYLGAGESKGPSKPISTCVSDADGSCATWVPQSHPFLFVGGSPDSGSNFQQCSGSATAGSVSCSTTGSSAYVTANANAGFNFSAFMIACKTADLTPGLKVGGADLTWYRNCGSQCGFSIIYPFTDSGGGDR